MQKGASREQGYALIISELGPADAVASEFNDEGTKGSPSTGLWRWLPLAPPLILFVVAAAVSGWSLVWLANGWTVGERATQRAYLLSALTFGVLAYAAHFSIRRAKHDPRGDGPLGRVWASRSSWASSRRFEWRWCSELRIGSYRRAQTSGGSYLRTCAHHTQRVSITLAGGRATCE